MLNNIPIPFSTTIRNLGLHIEADLSWKMHISNVSRKIHYALHNLCYGAYSLPTIIKLLLINALILPIIDYASPAFSDLSKFQHLKIDHLLNSALRLAFNLKRFQHVSPFRRKAIWITAHNRRLYYSLVLIIYFLHQKV